MTETVKIVYNACFGGFGLSHKAIMRYAEIKGFKLYAYTDIRDANHHCTGYRELNDQDDPTKTWMIYYSRLGGSTDKDTIFANGNYFYDRDIPRHDPALVQVVEELGEDANGMCAELRIEEVTKGTAYRIDEYDGRESVMTNGDYDWSIA